MMKRIKAMYLDYFNNFLTIQSFADYYNISYKTAFAVVSVGRTLKTL